MIRGVVFFDVDGTLVPYISSGQHLAEFLGHAELIRQVEADYRIGALSSREAAVLNARGWATRTPAEVRGFLESLPLVDGIAETVLWCRRQGLVPVLATLAWDLVGAHLLGHNADGLINLFTMAIQSKIRASELKRIIFAYPTHASDVRYML